MSGSSPFSDTPPITQVTTETLTAACSGKDLYNNIQGVYDNYSHFTGEGIDSENQATILRLGSWDRAQPGLKVRKSSSKALINQNGTALSSCSQEGDVAEWVTGRDGCVLTLTQISGRARSYQIN